MTIARFYRFLSALFLFLLTPVAASGNELVNMYERDSLVQEKSRFERKTIEIYEKGIWPQLTENEQYTLAGVRFKFPLVGEITRTPMDYYSGEDQGQVFVAMPVFSLLFLEDLCTAYAWLHTNDYSLETIDEYVTMLKYKKASDFPHGYPPPLRALQIPNDALADKQVDELSLRFRNSAFAFILLHELGHMYYKHRGYEGTPTAQARLNEENADRFALDVLQKASTIPMGAVLFFQAQAYFMPSRGQLRAEGRLQSERDWEDYLNTKVTHPLTADRLRSMALHMYKTASKASSSPDGETLRYIATRLDKISEILEIEELQGCMAAVASHADLSTLAPRRPREMTGKLMEQWCQKK